MAPRGRPPKPTEQKRLTGNPGKRKLPDQKELVLLPSAYDIPEPSRQLLSAGQELWDRIWGMGQTWISPSTDVDLLLMTCELLDERRNLRIQVMQNNRPDERKALRDLDRQLVANLSLLGFTPTDRSRLGVAEVKRQSKLEELRSRASQNSIMATNLANTCEQAALTKSRGSQVSDFIDTFAIQTKETVAGYAGDKMQLRDWQHELFRHLFAVGTDGKFRHRTALIGMARKNGKSALGSGIGLWSLIMGPAGGEVYSCAADKDQARIVFSDAKRMIKAEPELDELCNVYRDAIEVPATGSVYRVLSSESYSKEGLSPTCVIFDELHASPNRELFDVMQLGMGARREPMLIAVTTAGVKADSSGQDSIAYNLYQYGKRVAQKEVTDPSFFMAWWEAENEADHHLESTWKQANPAYGDLNDPKDFEAMVKRTPEAEFRTKRCNQWVSSQTAWLPNGAWEQLEVKREISADTPVVLGFDGSFSGDASVIVGVTCEEQPYVFMVKAWEKQPEDVDDWRVDILEVENTIIEFCGTHNVREIACDPFRWQRTMQVLDEAGFPIVEWPSTSPARMVPACAKFYDAVVSNKLTHDGNPLLLRHLQNAVVKTDRLGPRIVKEHRGSPRKIDAAVASIIGFDRATVSREEPVVPQFFSF